MKSYMPEDRLWHNQTLTLEEYKALQAQGREPHTDAGTLGQTLSSQLSDRPHTNGKTLSRKDARRLLNDRAFGNTE